MAGWGFRFLIPVRAGWAGAGFFPWAIKGRGAGFSQGYSFGRRAEGTERSSSGGRKASGPASFWPGALWVRRALAAPINFLNAVFSLLFLLGLCGRLRSRLAPRALGWRARPGVCVGRGDGKRGGRCGIAGRATCEGRARAGSRAGVALAGGRGRRGEPSLGQLRSGRVDWLGGRGRSGRDLRKAKYQSAVEG